MTIRPRRSVLYMPGTNTRALEKAKSLAVDAVVLDLEDSVAPEAKEAARAQVVAAVKGGGYGHRELVIRINALDTPWAQDDIAAAAAAGPDAILLPKPNSAAEIDQASAALTKAGAPERTKLWAMMETPRAMLSAAALAGAAQSKGSRLACLVLGLNDLAKETRADFTTDRMPAMTWLATTVLAARANGLDVLDAAYNNFKDAEGFRRECVEGRRLGMDGKTLIHPDQIAIANEVFAPPAAEVAWARRILAAFAEPAAKGKGVITIDGRMVELLHAEMAKRTVALADAIAKRQ